MNTELRVNADLCTRYGYSEATIKRLKRQIIADGGTWDEPTLAAYIEDRTQRPIIHPTSITRRAAAWLDANRDRWREENKPLRADCSAAIGVDVSEDLWRLICRIVGRPTSERRRRTAEVAAWLKRHPIMVHKPASAGYAMFTRHNPGTDVRFATYEKALYRYRRSIEEDGPRIKAWGK